MFNEGNSFTSMGQTKEASPRWGVPKASDLSLLARKGERNPLQGFRTTIERTDVGSSPTVTTTHPVSVQDQRLPVFLRTLAGYALFRPRGTQKGYADHLKTAYSLRQLVHINMLHILLVLKTRQPFEIKRRGGFPKWFDVSTT